MSRSCENCGCKVYNGHCVNCHEETYIGRQNTKNDESICFSKEFNKKLVEQEAEAKKIRKGRRINERKIL